MTTPDKDAERFEEIPPDQAPQLVPWTENSNYLSPGGMIAGMSAFADGATSDFRSKRFKIMARIIVGVLVISMILGGISYYTT